LNSDRSIIESEEFTGKIEELVQSGSTEREIVRYRNLLDIFYGQFKEEHISLFSSPGRVEIGGNHTDHNNGIVLAAAVNVDMIAAAAANGTNVINLISEGYPTTFKVDINNLKQNDGESGTAESLIRGIAAQFNDLGYNIGGFNACLQSKIPVGSGLSSSAALENLIGGIFSCLFNNSQVDSKVIAQTGQYAENNYFGKPCGLMDQLASAMGGLLKIDFKDPKNPDIQSLNYDFNENGYQILVVDTGKGHQELNHEYASIPGEMKRVAEALGKNVCREIEYREVFENIKMLREKVGDRAVLRCLHLFDENVRVDSQFQALKENNLGQFLDLVNESGLSSMRWLQNCRTNEMVSLQNIIVALALTEKFMGENKIKGACRIHGGGFEGSVLVFLPAEHISAYIAIVDKIFGRGASRRLRIRNSGACCLYRDKYE
jgi:galactokinase